MKKTILFILVSALSCQFAWADCAATPVSEAAKNLDLAGKVSIKTKGAKETKYDIASKVTEDTKEGKEAFSLISEIAKEMNSDVISPMYVLVNQGELMAVVRNKNSCEISLLGGDGEENNLFKIAEDGIKLNSISTLDKEDSARVTTVKKIGEFSNSTSSN